MMSKRVVGSQGERLDGCRLRRGNVRGSLSRKMATNKHNLDESHTHERVYMAGINVQCARKKRPRADEGLERQPLMEQRFTLKVEIQRIGVRQTHGPTSLCVND